MFNYIHLHFILSHYITPTLVHIALLHFSHLNNILLSPERRGHREAFAMKYELIKRQMDIDRKYKGQLKSSLPAPIPPTSSPSFSPSFSSSFSSPMPGKSLGGYGFTAMQRHRERTVQCRVCSALYLETQNNSFSCRTHSAVREIRLLEALTYTTL